MKSILSVVLSGSQAPGTLDAVARLTSAFTLRFSKVAELVGEVVASMRNEINGRPVNVICDEHPPATGGWSSWQSSSSSTTR
jgi:hypothetical protein